MDARIMRELVSREDGITVELPKEVLRAIRMDGVYDEMTIDPASGRVLSRIHLTGRYDSYSNEYELNGGRWKVEGQRSWPGGEETYTMRLEVRHGGSRR